MSCDWIMTGYLHSTSLYDVFFFCCVCLCVCTKIATAIRMTTYTHHTKKAVIMPPKTLSLWVIFAQTIFC